MNVTKDSVINGVKKYINTEIAPRMTGFNAFMVYFALPSLDKKVSELYDNFSHQEMFSDLFQDGKANLDAVKQRAYNALEQTGGKLHINVMNSDIALGKEDIDILYRYISGS